MTNISIKNAKNSIVISGNVSNSKVQIGNNITENFNALQKAIDTIDSTDKIALKDATQALESSVNMPNFNDKYKAFIQLAANHMTALTPFIPFLTSLL